jgi:hypothetical protein
MTVAAATLLCTLVLPLWIAAGLADWWLHRQSEIEHTSGVAENIFHLALFTLIALGAVITATLEINSGVVALLFAIFILHELLTWFGLKMVSRVRFITPLEQMVHSLMEILPLTVLAILMVEQLQPNVARGWKLQVRDDLDWVSLAAAAAAVVLFNVTALLNETARCLSAKAAPPDTR